LGNLFNPFNLPAGRQVRGKKTSPQPVFERHAAIQKRGSFEGLFIFLVFYLFFNRKERKGLRKVRKGFLPQKAHKKNKRNKDLTADAQIFINRKERKVLRKVRKAN
jgi:hypothetical protein